ncbi:MAG: ABC-F family ATP-binding cassette domain-containing protein [Lautropia sp.]
MIRFSDLTLARAGKPLFSHASLLVSAGERIALIGPNGSGKSSLIALLRGELAPEAGSVECSPMRVGWLSQQVPSSDLPAVRYVMNADAALLAAEAQVEAAEAQAPTDDGAALAAAYDAWIVADGPSANARASELLAGLGFSDALMREPVSRLSGGWKMRLNLACVLMGPSDLLLLDEPTNHLDLDAVLWLERQLGRHPATQLIVSHDRDFLDRVVDACLSIEDGSLRRYAGGYTACESIRAEQAMQRERERRAQQTRIEHLSAFVERFRAKATKARQAQSRLKALERIEQIAPLRATRGIEFSFESPPEGPDPLIDARELRCGYAQEVVRVPGLTVRRGARIGILGRNGAGKTTLIRTLLGMLPALGGEVVRAQGLKVGYLAQQHIDDLRANESALQHLSRAAPGAREQVLRGWLGQFGFGGDDALRPVGPMSGGEKARLGLALLAWQRPGFLVLDEPTNHLDASTRDALADALADFEGALVLVSHDRYLLRATVDEFRLIDEGRLVPFDGDLDDYASWLQQSRNAGAAAGTPAARAPLAPAPTPTPATATAAKHRPQANEARATASAEPRAAREPDRRERARQRAGLAALARPLEDRIRRIDSLLARHQATARLLDERLSASDAYDDPDAAAEAARERAYLAGEIAQLEDEWLERHDALERLRRDGPQRENG